MTHLRFQGYGFRFTPMLSLRKALDAATLQLLDREHFPLISAPAEPQLDGLARRSHCARPPPMRQTSKKPSKVSQRRGEMPPPTDLATSLNAWGWRRRRRVRLELAHFREEPKSQSANRALRGIRPSFKKINVTAAVARKCPS